MQDTSSTVAELPEGRDCGNEAAFWRERSLTADEGILLGSLFEAHAQCVSRNNISSYVLKAVAVGSSRYENSIAAALLSIGGVHAPLQNAFRLINDPHAVDLARVMVVQGERVPGWGNSFVKGPDAVWEDTRFRLQQLNPTLLQRIIEVSDVLNHYGKMIHPNAAAYSAAVAITLEIPVHITPWLFIRGRLDAWTKLLI